MSVSDSDQITWSSAPFKLLLMPVTRNDLCTNISFFCVQRLHSLQFSALFWRVGSSVKFTLLYLVSFVSHVGNSHCSYSSCILWDCVAQHCIMPLELVDQMISNDKSPCCALWSHWPLWFVWLLVTSYFNCSRNTYLKYLL